MMSGRAAITAEQAVRLHQAGDLAAAAAAYRTLLAKDPRNGQLLNLLGVALLQMGDSDQAVRTLRESLRYLPNAADTHDNLGSALRASGNPAPAVEAHRKALQLRPNHGPFLFNLGNALADMGAHRQAVDSYHRSLAVRPHHVGALFNLANSLRCLGDAEGAITGYRAVLAEQPAHAQAWNNLGAVLAGTGELAGAEDAYRRALDVRPGHAETMSNLGNVLVQRGHLGAGLEYHLAATQAAPDSADAHIFLGVALQELDRPEAAIEAYRQGLRVEPDNVRGLTNLGAALELCGRLSEADAVLSRALSLAPDAADIWGNIALCRLAEGDIVRGRQALDRALSLDPELARARLARALLRLQQGDVDGGWRDYAWRFAAGEALPDRRFAIPDWTGSTLKRGRLLLWREQGLGDEIMFASLYKEAMQQADCPPGAATIECDPRLTGLFTRSFPQANVRPYIPATGDTDRPETPDMDAHAPGGHLPALMRPLLSAFDGALYLAADKRRQARSLAWLDSLPPGIKVGICWRSSLITTRRRANYAASTDWAAILRVPGVIAINLQHGAKQAEIEALEQAAEKRLHSVPDLDLKNDLDGLAGLLSVLDLVITAPTAVGEFAGALGTPVWRLSGNDDWSTFGVATRPWFTSMRVIPHDGTPSSAINKAAHLLAQILPPDRKDFT